MDFLMRLLLRLGSDVSCLAIGMPADVANATARLPILLGSTTALWSFESQAHTLAVGLTAFHRLSSIQSSGRRNRHSDEYFDQSAFNTHLRIDRSFVSSGSSTAVTKKSIG